MLVCDFLVLIVNDEYKEIFNLAFQEMRKQVENCYNRLKTWFPILGNQTHKWHCDEDLLVLTVHCCARLHNWLMRIRKLDYNPTTNPAYLFRQYH
jgi:hypothetical protein